MTPDCTLIEGRNSKCYVYFTMLERKQERKKRHKTNAYILDDIVIP